jgi:hypothetical protein
MLSRRNWITESIGHVLRKGLSVDPDQVFDSVSQLYSDWADVDPDVAVDSVIARSLPRGGDRASSYWKLKYCVRPSFGRPAVL